MATAAVAPATTALLFCPDITVSSVWSTDDEGKFNGISVRPALFELVCFVVCPSKGPGNLILEGIRHEAGSEKRDVGGGV